MRHVELVGDSVFDNGEYVEPGEISVTEQLSNRLPREDTVNSRAVDGYFLRDVPDQLEEVSPATSHIFFSMGGTDALTFLSRLERFERPTNSIGEGVDSLAKMRESFMLNYRKALDQVVQLGCAVVPCTIYTGNFSDRTLQDRIETLLPILNDVIVGTAYDYGLPLIELRKIFVDADDYATVLEPSVRGGRKFTEVMVRVLDEHDFSRGRTSLYSNARTHKLPA